VPDASAVPCGQRRYGRSADGKRVQDLYVSCLHEFNQSVFEELCTLIEKSTLPDIRKTLANNGLNYGDHDQDICQEAKEGVWTAIVNHSRRKYTHEAFIKCASTIYHNKTRTFIRIEKKKYAVRGGAAPIGEPLWPDGPTLDEIIESTLEGTVPGYDRSNTFIEAYTLLCKAVFSSQEFPPKVLAFFYASILPHMCGYIPDSKQASAKFAHHIIGEHIIQTISTAVEEIVLFNLEKEFVWGDSFIDQLEKLCTLVDPQILLKDVMYISLADQKQTSHWANAMLAPIIKETRRLVNSDQDLVEYLKEYIKSGEKIYRLIEEAKKK